MHLSCSICVEERSFGLTPMRFQTDPIFGFGSNYEKGQTGILRVLCTRKRNLVLGANAQRISRPSYTAVVRTNGYLRCAITCDIPKGLACVRPRGKITRVRKNNTMVRYCIVPTTKWIIIGKIGQMQSFLEFSCRLHHFGKHMFICRQATTFDLYRHFFI